MKTPVTGPRQSATTAASTATGTPKPDCTPANSGNKRPKLPRDAKR